MLASTRVDLTELRSFRTSEEGKSAPSFSFRSVGLAVKPSVSTAVDLSSIPAFAVDHFPGRVIPVT